VGSDMGSTVKNIYYGLIGQVIAWFVYWVFMGFFPEGYDGENTGVLYAALAVISLFTFGLIFLKIDETVRFWALISFTGGFAMNMVKPGVENEHSTGGFKLDYRGTAENGIILFVVAGVLSTLIFAIPPILSLDRGQKRVVIVLKKLKQNIQELNTYYARDTAGLDIVSIKENFALLTKELEEAEAYGQASWYESLGSSSRLLLTTKLTSLIRDLIETARPLFNIVAEEDFGPSHSAMMKHIKTPMTNVVDSTIRMVEMLIDACEDGSVSKDEKANLKAEIDKMPGLVDALQQKVKAAQGGVGNKKIQEEVLGEHYVVLTICYLAQMVQDQSKFFINYKGREGLMGCGNPLLGLFTYDKGDIRWAATATLCLLVNFFIGYRGWCDDAALEAYEANPTGEAPVCFINKYTAGLANINVILMSRYSGGTLKAALERVAAVVFASVVGQIGFVALGWCADFTRMLTVVVVFFVTWGFMYFTYDGSESSKGIAQRLAAITVSSLMSDCSDESGTAVTYSSSYHSLSEIILGVLVMTLFDTLFGDKPAATQAAEALEDAVEGYRKVFIRYFNGEIDDTQLSGALAEPQADLAEAKSAAGFAVMEPRFWRPTFNNTLYETVIAAYETFFAELNKISRVLEDDKGLLLDALPCYHRLKAQMFGILDQTTGFVVASIRRDGEELHRLATEKSMIEPTVIGMLVNDMNGQREEPKLKNRDGEMPVVADSRRSAVATMIQSLEKGMGTLQRACFPRLVDVAFEMCMKRRVFCRWPTCTWLAQGRCEGKVRSLSCRRRTSVDLDLKANAAIYYAMLECLCSRHCSLGNAEFCQAVRAAWPRGRLHLAAAGTCNKSASLGFVHPHAETSRSIVRWAVAMVRRLRPLLALLLAPVALAPLTPWAWLGPSPSLRPRLQRLPCRAQAAEKSDGSWEPKDKIYSNSIRSLPGSATAYRKVLPLGKAVIRKRAKFVKVERISREKSQNVAEELVSVMRGPNLPGRTFKGGFLTAPHLGTPSRLIVLEDPPAGVEALSETEQVEQGRPEPFPCKAVFNPQLRPASNATSVYWERDPSVPGYRALVERYNEVQVSGFDPSGSAVDFVARGWQARLFQQAADVLDGSIFIDRCVMRSLCHLDAHCSLVVINGMAMAISSYNLGYVVHIQLTAEVAASISLVSYPMVFSTFGEIRSLNVQRCRVDGTVEVQFFEEAAARALCHHIESHRGLLGLKSDSANADSAFLFGSAVSVPESAAPAGADRKLSAPDSFNVDDTCLASGQETRSSIIVGQVPKDCSAITFLEQLQLHNILDYINFFYMPVDKAKRRSCGYVFLDFRHPSDVLRFKSKLKKIGMGIGAAKSGRKLHVHFAHMQGWKELLERYSEPEYLFHPDTNERPQLFFRRILMLDRSKWVCPAPADELCPVHVNAEKTNCNDPLPSDCPPLGVTSGRRRPQLTDEELQAAISGGSRGLLGFLPSFIQPTALLVGSLILRLKADEVRDFSAPEVAAAAKELRDALDAGDNPLGVAAPQFGKNLRMVAIGESEEAIERLSTRARISEEHRPLKPTVLVNPVVTPKEGCAEAFFWERHSAVVVTESTGESFDQKWGHEAVEDHAPSWADLQAALEAKSSKEEKEFRSKLSKGQVANAMANLRVFDKDSDSAKRVTLYRDTASWCPYCHKVWLLLEEKQIPYNVKRVNMACYGNKPPEFLALQPNGQIPVAVIDGEVLRSSDAIIERILRMNGASSEVDQSLDPFDDAQSTNLLRLERQLFSAWLGWLCRGGGRPDFERTLRKVEDTLSSRSSGPYFLGDRFSLVDIMYAPFIERAVASLAYFKGYNIRDRAAFPAINAWFDAMESRASYRAAKSDYYTHAHDLPPQLGGCNAEAGGKAARDDIDGHAWKLPLQADPIEPEWSWISSAEARREAAERLINNHEAVARFASRARSGPGFPPAWAELSDPNAKPAEKWISTMDVFLRHTVDMLLAGDAAAADRDDADPLRSASWEAAQKSMQSLKGEDRNDLAECLQYLQQRVGVPRDMSLNAARRLRGELGPPGCVWHVMLHPLRHEVSASLSRRYIIT
ncbi:PDF1A, partial [Symbiodinium microadriaticum]